ncbi:MAG: GDSL-type esterase/lipase family protein [Oscillospiraceae bacterium]|nr:GDSL-type esterase/lipase family protein [Oscillospiraceae bacterium]
MTERIRRNAYTGRRKRGGGGAVVILMLLLIVALSFGGACLWQNYDDQNGGPSQSVSAPPESPDPESQDPESQDPESQESSSEPEKEESEESESSSEAAAPAGTNYGKAVPESARVNSDYFDDALFVGDSVTDGIQAYAIMKNTTVIAHTGINPETISTKEVIRTDDGSMITMLDAMALHPEAKKIYIMLGANGIAWIERDPFISSYEAFIDQVKEQHPDAVIYIQSILPVTKSKQDGDERYANSKIDSYNAAIQKMAEQKQVYYLNVAEAFKDEEGNLPEEASPVDGMHFGPKYYEKWFEYLKIHTAEG